MPGNGITLHTDSCPGAHSALADRALADQVRIMLRKNIFQSYYPVYFIASFFKRVIATWLWPISLLIMKAAR